jgi:hypothetical protein
VTQRVAATMGETRSAYRAALLASVSIEVRRLVPHARAIVIKHRVGSRRWWVAAVLVPGGQPLEHPGTFCGVQRAVAHSLGLLAPHLPSTEQVTLNLSDPRQLVPHVSTGRRTLPPHKRLQRSQITKPYRVVSRSKHRDTRRVATAMARWSRSTRAPTPPEVERYRTLWRYPTPITKSLRALDLTHYAVLWWP